MFGGDLWFLALAIFAAAFSVYLSKSLSKEEKKKQEEISLEAFSVSILIPAGLILLLFLLFVVVAVWKTYA